MCVARAQGPSPDSRLCWSPEKAHSQRNPESPATNSAREWNVLLGCCWQELGSRGAGEGRGSRHKASSVLLGTEGGGAQWADPSCCSVASSLEWGPECEEAAQSVTFTQSFLGHGCYEHLQHSSHSILGGSLNLPVPLFTHLKYPPIRWTCGVVDIKMSY